MNERKFAIFAIGKNIMNDFRFCLRAYFDNVITSLVAHVAVVEMATKTSRTFKKYAHESTVTVKVSSM